MPTERSPIRPDPEVGGNDGDKNRRHRHRDGATLDNSRASESKRDAKDVSDILGSKGNVEGERTNNTDPTAVPRSQSFFQHDDRRTAARDGRHSGRRLTSESGWWKDSKSEERAPHKAAEASYSKERDRKSRALGADDHEWRHDRFSEAMADAHPPTKKRRPFREEKLPSESETQVKNIIPEPNKVSELGNSVVRSGRWEERARERRPLERKDQDRGYARERSFSNRGRIENIGFSTRERSNGVHNDGKFRGKDKYGGAQGPWSKGAPAEKWKHDLFDEANRSPSPKKEEDPVAKVEALLSMWCCLILSIFYPLGGRVLDKNYIECSDEGVPYIEAQVKKPLELKDVVLKANAAQLNKLVPPYGQEGFTSLLLAIQVNKFACGGLAIGVKMNHAISDAFSMLMFVKTWTSMARDSNDLSSNLPRPCFDTWKLFPPSPRHGNHSNPDFIKDVPVTKLFLFNETNLLALRSKLFPSYSTSDVNKSETIVPSLGMVLSAFIWSRIKVACHSDIRENIPHEVFQAVNLRPKLALHDEQSYYFGNMAVNAIAKSSTKINNSPIYPHKVGSGEVEIYPTLPLSMNTNDDNETIWLRDMMGKMYESFRKLRNEVFIRDMQQSKEDLRFVMEQFERHRKGEVVILGFSNLSSLPVYEADFGWGKPVWVTVATLVFRDLVILIPAGPSSKDIVACVSLIGEDMAKLERDTKFNSLVCKAFHVSSKL